MYYCIITHQIKHLIFNYYCILIYQTYNRLFEDAALKLNLRALTEFVHSLCHTIRHELFKLPDKKKFKSDDNTNNVTLLTRLSRLMLRCIKSGRPLFHMIKIWSIVLPCLMEVSTFYIKICTFFKLLIYIL